MIVFWSWVTLTTEKLTTIIMMRKPMTILMHAKFANSLIKHKICT